MDVHLLLLLGIERPSADAAEDADLVARLVHGPVAVDALGDRQSVAAERQFEDAMSSGVGRGLNPLLPGVSGEVSCTTPQPVVAVGQVGELADIGDAQLHVVQVVDASAGVEDLVDPRLRGLLDVEDDQALLPAAT